MEDIITILNKLSPLEWILGSLLLFFFVVQLIFYLFYYLRPYRFWKKKKDAAIPDDLLPAISVIVTSKNSAKALEQNLPFIMDQDYPNFEVIVVNRGSTDDTDIVLKAAELKYPRFYHTYVPAESNGLNEKRLALTLGIKAAKNDFLLFTESYCKPCSNKWIKEFGKEFSQGKEVILGLCRLDIPKGTRMRGFMLYDNLIHHLKFLSMAILHKPYMGISRNIAYKKELFYNNKGYTSILNMDSGEDNLHIDKVAPKQKTGVLLSKESATETDNMNHISLGRTLKPGQILSRQIDNKYLGGKFTFETLSKNLFYLLLACIVILSILGNNIILAEFALALFLIRFVLQWRVINLNSRLFNAGRFHFNLPFYDILQPFSYTRSKKYTVGKYGTKG